MPSPHRVVLTDFFPPEIVAEVARHVPPGFEFSAVKDASRQAVVDAIRDADFLIASGVWGLDAELIRAAPKLRFVQKWGIGVDKFDLVALRDAGIPIAITSGANAIPVAEHALALMLAVARRIMTLDRTTRAGQFLKSGLRMTSVQLYGKTIGIVGLGNIGRQVARRVQGFDVAEVLYHDVAAKPEAERALGVKRVPLDELLARSDFVTLHVPLDASTRGLIGARELARMKPRAILINTCRGGVVAEEPLHEALRDWRILGAGIDVFETEPTRADHPLFALENVVVTPHAAGSTFDNVSNMARHCFRNIQTFVEGRPLPEEDLLGAPGPARGG